MEKLVVYTQENLKVINDKLFAINSYGLGAEVIVGALGAMKMNPELSIIDAFLQGCGEWDF